MGRKTDAKNRTKDREKQLCPCPDASRAATCKKFARFARRKDSGEDYSLCGPCSKWAKGKQTAFQADRALYVRLRRKEKTKLTHVSSLPLSAATHEHWVAKKKSGDTVNAMEIYSDTEGAGQGEAGDEPGDSASTKKAKLCETEKEGGFHRISALDRNSVPRKSSPEFTQRQKSKELASPSTSTENADGNAQRAKFSPDHESEVMAAGSKSKEGVWTTSTHFNGTYTNCM